MGEHSVRVRFCEPESGSDHNGDILAVSEILKELFGVVHIGTGLVFTFFYARAAGDALIGVDSNDRVLTIGSELGFVGVVYGTNPYTGVTADTFFFIKSYEHSILISHSI